VFFGDTHIDPTVVYSRSESYTYEVSISSIELQIIYKLRLAKGAETTDGKDFEDALHLYLTFEDQFKPEQLEVYVEQLGVEDYYVELKRV